MPVYNYSVRKYAKLKATWIIGIIAFLVIFAINSIVFTSTIKPETISTAQYVSITLSLYTGVATTSALFGAIFTAFAGAKVFKDEIEEGTFLIVISKPVSRGRIVFEKWLAYATVITIFALFMTIAFVLPALFFDKIPDSNPNKSQISPIMVRNNLGKGFFILFGVALVVCFIFSSIALIISTKMGVGGTIGLTTALGIALPLTSLFGSFSEKQTHATNFVDSQNVSISSAQDQLASWGITQKNFNTAIQPEYLNGNKKVTLPAPAGSKIPALQFPLTNYQDLAIIYSYASSFMLSSGFSDDIDNPTKITDDGLGTIGIKERDVATYSFISYIDLNYQVTRLGAIASSAIISDKQISDSIGSGLGGSQNSPQTSLKQKVVKAYKTPEMMQALTNFGDNWTSIYGTAVWDVIASPSSFHNLPPLSEAKEMAFENFFDYTTLVSNAKSALSLSDFTDANSQVNPSDPSSTKVTFWMNYLANKGKIDKIEYVDFLNKYAVLAVYLVIAATLVPLSFLIVRRQDYQ